MSLFGKEKSEKDKCFKNYSRKYTISMYFMEENDNYPNSKYFVFFFSIDLVTVIMVCIICECAVLN